MAEQKRCWPSATPERAALVESHTERVRFVVARLVRRWNLPAVMSEECQLAGFEGLWLAALRWDPRAGLFWPYARKYAIGYVRQWLCTVSRLGHNRRDTMIREGRFVPCTLSLDARLDRVKDDGPSWQFEDNRARQAAQRAELRRQVEEILSFLPPDDRDLLRQRYLDRVKLVDLGRAHGVSRACMGERIKTILKRLKRRAVLAGFHYGRADVCTTEEGP